MTVVFVVHDFTPARENGVEVFCRGLAREMISRGQFVAVIAGTVRKAAGRTRIQRQTVDGIRVYRVLRGLDRRFAESMPVDATYRHGGVERVVQQALDELAPDVVHVHHTINLSAGVVALAARYAPVVLTAHDHWFMCQRVTLLDRDGGRCAGPEDGGKCARCLSARGPGRVVTRLMRSPTRMRRRLREHRSVTEHATLVTHPARFQAALLERLGVPVSRLRHVPYGVDVSAPSTKSPRPADARFAIGYLGGLLEHKGALDLVRAFSRAGLDRARLLIHGPRSGDSRYNAKVPAAGGGAQVCFGGSLPRAEIPAFLERLNVLAVPSRWLETGPLVALEALSVGTPVIGPDMGGFRELPDDGPEVILYDPDDPDGLTRALSRAPALARGKPAAVRRTSDACSDFMALYEEERALRGT